MVLSGEHGTFSRLAVVVPAGTGWQFGRRGDGYELRIDADLRFDTTRVFDLIARSRITDVAAGQRAGSLIVSVGPDSSARAFEADGAIVVDVTDGPPPDGSLSELPIDPYPGGPRPTPDTSAGALPLYRANRPPPSDPWVDAIWTVGEARRARSGARPSADGSGQPGADALLAAENALLRQLARAASQGLVSTLAENEVAALAQGGAAASAAPEPVRTPNSAGPDAAAASPQAEAEAPPGQSNGGGTSGSGEGNADPLPPGARRDAATGIDAAAKALANVTAGQVGIRARTSQDRDMIANPELPPEPAAGMACPPAEELDVAGWSGEGAPDRQIATARTGMVGEFDRPDLEKVTGLARIYLTFGLGAEARDVLDAFAVADHRAPWLRSLAAVMEGRIPEDPALKTLAACPGPVALWGVLATPPDAPGKWDAGGVLRALSALPPRLRILTAPGIAERLLARGDTDGARAAMQTLARLPGHPGPGAALVMARIEMADQKIDPALDEISGVIASNDPSAPDAVILAIQGRLSRGEAVDPALADTASALAFEHRGEPVGDALASAHVAALASAGRFDAAFAALATYRSDSPQADFSAAVRQIFRILAETAPDEELVTIYDAKREELRKAAPDPALRRALAKRLADLGFSAETESLLEPGGIGGAAGLSTEADRMTLARAALADMRPDAAMVALAGIAGPAAADMRDRALALAGDTPPRTDASRPEPQPRAAPAAPVPGPIARSKTLVSESQSLRERMNGLLGQDSTSAATQGGTSAQGTAAGSG